jgi:TrmH family RNA methyltransferase
MTPKKIQSTRNPVVKEALDIREKRSRFKHRAFLIEGPHLIESALMSEGRCTIRKIFYTEAFRRKHAGLMKRLSTYPLEQYEVRASVLGKLSETDTPQGITAIASYEQSKEDALKNVGILIVLDGVQDPGNVGTVIRTSDAAGASAVVLLPGSCDPFSSKALRASAGSVFSIPLLYEKRDALENKLNQLGIPIVTTTANARRSLFDTVLKPPLALAFGNESRGISPELKKAASLTVRVPIQGRAESLNVASTAAICIYEALRQHQA